MPASVPDPALRAGLPTTPGSGPAGAALFDGPGEMRARCRALDWAGTPLGPVAGWSSSLRTIARTVLGSRQPMFLFWGPEHVQLYNDAYRPSLGGSGGDGHPDDRHPRALGMRGAACWTDIWDTIGPQIAQVMGGGEGTWHEDQHLPIWRNGRLEDVWWTYAYTPVPDDDGRIGGVLVTCQETTGRVLAERRQAFATALAERLAATDDATAAMDAACAALAAYLGVAQVGFGEVVAAPAGSGDPEARIVVARDWTDPAAVAAGAIASLVGEWRVHDVGAALVRELWAGRTVAVADVAAAPRTGTPDVRTAHAALRTRARLAVPLVRDGRLRALLLVHHPAPRAWTPEEVALVEDACGRLWAAVERDRAEARLADGLAELEAVYRSAPIGMCVLDRDLRYVRINERLAEINGIPAAAHLGRTVRELLPDLAEAAEVTLRRILETGEALHDVEFRGTTPARPGIERVWLEQWLPLRDAGGTVVGVHVVAEEVTEQRRAERELREAAEAMPQLVWITTPEGYHDYYNARWYDYTGMPRPAGGRFDPAADAEGWNWKLYLHPDDHARSVARWARSLDTGAPYEIEYRFREAATGEYRWFLGRALPMRDAAGRITRWFGTCTDIHEQHLAREAAEGARQEAEAARAEAEQANRAKSQFLATMSHELRTPLNAIQGHVQLLDMELHGPLTSAQREALGRVERAQRHLLGLINNVLNFAKLETGTVEYDLRATDLRAVLADVAPMIEPQLHAKGHAHEWALADGACVVWADAEKLRQVLLNLLANAVKFTPAGGRIRVAHHVRGETPDVVYVRVSDTGPGIARDKQDSVFDPFVQVHVGASPHARAHEGTGLGLAISRELARGMGGELRVRSTPGAGATFTLTLRRASAPPGTPLDRCGSAAAGGAGEGGGAPGGEDAPGEDVPEGMEAGGSR